MKKLQCFLAVLAMFLVIIGVLVTSFEIVIYGDPQYQFYEKEYRKYEVADSLDMELEDVMEVTVYMMDYLIGREDELSIVTDVDGKRQDFFNEQDRLHMADVKNLFLGGLRLRTLVLAAAALMMIVLFVSGADMHKLLPKAYSIAGGIFFLLLVFLGAAFSIDFTACFRIFHEIFFTNDLWLFDPATDYMIRMLPEGFFADMVLRIGLTFVVFLLAVQAVFVLGRFFAARRREAAGSPEDPDTEKNG